MNDEIKTALEELFELMEMGEDNDSGDWPSVAVWSQGKYHVGPISDELYGVLTNLKELYLLAEEEPGLGED